MRPASPHRAVVSALGKLDILLNWAGTDNFSPGPWGVTAESSLWRNNSAHFPVKITHPPKWLDRVFDPPKNQKSAYFFFRPAQGPHKIWLIRTLSSHLRTKGTRVLIIVTKNRLQGRHQQSVAGREGYDWKPGPLHPGVCFARGCDVWLENF